MNFKTLVFAALIATAAIADDTFLVDHELRELSSKMGYMYNSTCSSDASCSSTYFSGLTTCCAYWKYNTTTKTPKPQNPLVMILECNCIFK